MERPASVLTRRRLLTGGAVSGVGFLAGCMNRAWSTTEHSPPDQVQLTVKTPPTDDDVMAASIGSQLTETLQTAGIDAIHEPITTTELHREVLLNHEFDIVVLRHHGFDNVDALRGLLHGRHLSEQGWQNPFGYSDGVTDELLDTQCQQSGSDRSETITNLLEQLLETAPYSAIVYPNRLAGARASVNASQPPLSPIEYVTLLSQAEESDNSTFRAGIFETTITERCNPISIDLGDTHTLLSLLYDPLVRLVGSDAVPWLASDVEWEEETATLTALVTLRENLSWHDETTLTTSDVAFTHEFLEDTSLGAAESPIPAPRYRSRRTLVDSIEQVDSRTIRFSFGERTRDVAERALTVPLLPEHIWEERAELVGNLLTEAIVSDNSDAVGSGLFQLAEITEGQSLLLEPFEGHALWQQSVDDLQELSLEALSYDELEFQLAANPGAAIDQLLEDELDLIAGSLSAADVGPLTSATDVDLLERLTNSFYLIGYNVRHPELGNPRFRRVLSQLIDREHVAREFFEDTATPATTYSELTGLATLTTGGTDTASLATFPGTDGEIDVEEVRALFRDAGYRYDDDVLLQ